MTTPLPHVSMGNTALDLSSGVANFAQGLRKERDARRQDALQQALLGIRRLEAEGTLAAAQQRPIQAYIDDLRSKGIYVRPGAQLGAGTDMGGLIGNAQAAQKALLDYEMIPPNQRGGMQAPPRTITHGGVTADIFVDPQHLRELMEQRQAAQRQGYLAQRQAYLKLAQDRFAFQRAKPGESQLQVGGGLPNIVAAHHTMKQIEDTIPEGANWAGMLKVLGETPLGRQFAPASAMMAVLSPDEQRYVIAMHRFLSEYFPAKGGKVLSENEVRQYFPIISATGFTSREAIQAVQDAREGNIGQVMWQSGPQLLQLIRSGQIDPSDVPPGVLETVESLYGTGMNPGPANPPKPKTGNSYLDTP